MKTTQIEMLDPAALKPYAANAKRHTAEQITLLANNIRAYGFRGVVLIDADDGIIAGHGRVRAAIEAGLSLVPCQRCDDLTRDQVRALRLADNRLAEVGTDWSRELLGAELRALDQSDVDLSLLGWDDDDLADLMADLPEVTTDAGASDASMEAVGRWGVRRGQLWGLGRHRLIVGDSSDPRDIARLMGGEEFTAVILDPPYEVDRATWSRWIHDPCIVFGQAVHIRMIPDRLWRFERVIVKRHKHRSATVQVRHAHSFVVQCGTEKLLPRDKKVTLPSVIEQESDTDHDHQKPSALIAEHLQHWTPFGNGIVLDPFAGSGSSIIACELAGRQCRAVEIEPTFAAAILDRWVRSGGSRPEVMS